MRKLMQTLTLAGITCFALVNAPDVQAQDNKGDKLGEYDEIVIKRNSDKDSKVTIEIKDGEVLIDGKKTNAYKDGDISVFRRRIRPVDGNAFNFNIPPDSGPQIFGDDNNGSDSGDSFSITPGKAVLGVFTEKKEAAGATVKEVAGESAAEKAGIKAGDVITAIDADKIAEPQDLFEKIGAHEPGDKVTVTYLRDKKENKVVVTLDERKGMGSMELFPREERPDRQERFFRRLPRGGDMGGFNFDGLRGFRDNNDVRLGLSVQDTEKGEGALVLGITAGSAAEKAGFKENDIITQFADSDINSARDVTNAYRDNKDKGTITVKIKRNNQDKTLEVRVPKKLHKADL